MLYSETSDKYYVGYSHDVQSRLDQHNTSDRSTYTSKHRPWVLKKAIALGGDRGLALRLERAVKRMKSRRQLELILDCITTVEQLAQLVRVPMNRD